MTLAEQRAWELTRELDVKLVTVLPGAICGPGLVRNTPSTDAIEGIMLGSMRMGAPDTNFPYVDIRDVVSAHVLAAEKECSGRFIVCNDHLPSFAELVDEMHAIDASVPRAMMKVPGFMMPFASLRDRLNHRMLNTPRLLTREFVDTIRGKVWNASNARIKRELGWTQSISLQDSLRDTMATLRANRAAHRLPSEPTEPQWPRSPSLPATPA